MRNDTVTDRIPRLPPDILDPEPRASALVERLRAERGLAPGERAMALAALRWGLRVGAWLAGLMESRRPLATVPARRRIDPVRLHAPIVRRAVALRGGEQRLAPLHRPR